MTILHCIRLLPFFAAFALAPDAARAGGAPPGKILVEAGEISGTTKKMRAKGGVRACFEQYILNTEELEYDRQNDFLRASGSFQLSNPGLGHDMEGGSVFYRPHMRRGEANNVRMSVGEEGLRAESETLVFENGAFLARNAEISSCKPESRDWTLDAKEVREEEGQLLARHVLLRARGVPVMYFPAFPVNISDEKRGGFLPPKAEYSGGGRIGLPYYFFPAENYDATITPEWLGEQGFLIGGEFRYLMPSYRGDAEISWNPEAGRGRQRIAHRWESESKYWRIDLAADNVSDSRYFIDFSDDSALLAARNLPRRIAVQYARDGWSGSALFETLKTLNYPDAPHNRLPQLRLRRDGGGGGFFWHSEWEYTRFAAQTAEQREGGRLLWRGAARRRFNAGGAAFIPEGGAHAAKYSGGAAFLTPFTRLRAESGYRPLFGGDYQLRAMYAYAPDTNRSGAPVYDSALREFSAGGIYDWNRFSGGDRASDASVAAYGAEIRFWDFDAGRERLALEIAQRYYFRRPRQILADEASPPERGFAGLLAEMRMKSGPWKAEGNAEWNPASESFDSVYADVRADYGRRLLRVGGLFEEEENLILGGAHPLGARADFGFLIRYILDEDRTAEAGAALSVRGECGCWRINIRGKNLIAAEKENKISYSIGLELTGLGKMGGNGYEAVAAELR